jgi:nucleotide-binding universal stress UspA family protein
MRRFRLHEAWRGVVVGGGDEGVRRIEEAWEANANTDLDAAAALVRAPGVAVERLIAQGEPDDAIREAIGGRGADMIAMASHGRGAVGRALFGSVADRVTRGSTVPVLIVRAADDAPPSHVTLDRIVVPLDGSALAERALPVAAAIARRLKVPVAIVRAIDAATAVPVAPGAIGIAPAGSAPVIAQLWDDAENEARTTVRDAVATLEQDGVQASGETLNGSPFFAISEATRPGDLLVLTSHGRSGIGRWLLGSVAEKLVREAPAPVLLVPATEREALAPHPPA